ncbi:hypothetical protein RCL1_002759 [Eukaryota sp. TZLM3-RCL]
MSRFVIKPLETPDYHRGYFEVLGQLTTVGQHSFDEFQRFFRNLPENIHPYVIEDTENNLIVACGTMMVEPKFTHNLSCYAHLEDIVVRENYRRQGLGKMMVNHLAEMGFKRGCNKVILSSRVPCIDFYKKCGFQEKNCHEMFRQK